MSYSEPSGPGVRMDSGVREGTVVGGQFDSMLAKLIVWGPDRATAIERARRALAEYRIEGLPTVIPFHQAIVTDPAFTAEDGNFTVYTKWIEEEWVNDLPEYTEPAELPDGDEHDASQKFVVEVGGRRIEVALPGNLLLGGGQKRKKSNKRRGGGAQANVSGDAVTAPMQGSVIKVTVEEGQEVEEGEVVVVLEAMKMENPVKAHKSGTVTDLKVATGAQINKGEPILEIK